MATKVAEAFVELTGRTDGVRKAFRDTEQLAKGTLGRIGKSVEGLFGGIRGGLGIGGAISAAGVGAFVAKAAKDFSTGVAPSLAALSIRTARFGQSLEAQLRLIKSFRAQEGGIVGASEKDVTQAVAQIAGQGFGPKQARRILRAGAGLSVEGGIDLQTAVSAILGTRAGGNLGQFGQFAAPGEFPEDVFRRAVAINEKGLRVLEKVGGVAVGKEFDELSSRVSDLNLAVGKAAATLIPTETSAESRERERQRINALRATGFVDTVERAQGPTIRLTDEFGDPIPQPPIARRDTPSPGILEGIAGESFDDRLRALHEAQNEFFESEVGPQQDRAEAGAGPGQGLPPVGSGQERSDTAGAMQELTKTLKEVDSTLKDFNEEVSRQNTPEF